MTLTSLKDVAQGRWRGILPALGLPASILTGKHGPCPLCRAGTDRFRWDDRDGRGTWICSACGAGDGISLVMQMRGVDFKGAVALIEPLVGAAPVVKSAARPSEDEQREWMNSLWRGSKLIRPDDPAGLYLTRRTGMRIFPGCLRYHEAAGCTETDSRQPALLAKVVDRDGKKAVNVHRTYLTLAGEKACLADPRRLMPGTIPEGSAIRLTDVAETLGIAEGIETALAATELHGIPCWAAVNAVILAKWMPPPGVKKVVIFGDHDHSFTGQHAAYKVANRIAVKEKIEVEVRIPNEPGADWQDVYELGGSASLPAHHHPHDEDAL